MSTLSPGQWQELSPYLDHVLAMPEEERAALAAVVREQKSGTGSQLRATSRRTPGAGGGSIFWRMRRSGSPSGAPALRARKSGRTP